MKVNQDNSKKPIRKYAPIWIEVKAKGFCRITAPKPLHRRIIRAVQKEKYEDLAYQFILKEQEKKSKLVFKQSNAILEFKLIQGLCAEDF